MPAVAVDQATGTLVVDYYDTRNDAANARYATYVTTSIDGGNTFAPDTFANAPNTAFDTITQQNVTLGPIPDDQSAGNPNTDTRSPSATIRVWRCSRATSTRPGRATRAAAQRHEPARHPDRAHADRRRPAGRQQHDGRGHAPDRPAAAARGADHDQHPDPVTGVPQFDGFFVQFDRYIDPSTFTASSIEVSYLAPGATQTVVYGTGPGMIPLTNVAIIPQDSPPSAVGVKSFLVTFSPLEGVGTYSYAIGPRRQRPDPHGHRGGRADLLGQQDGSERRRAAGRAHARPVCDAPSDRRHAVPVALRPDHAADHHPRPAHHQHRGPRRQRQPDRAADQRRRTWR